MDRNFELMQPQEKYDHCMKIARSYPMGHPERKKIEKFAWSINQKIKEPETQCEAILGYLIKHGSITPIDAQRLCGCMRLASRVLDLKKQGHTINKVTENKNGKTYARYSLA